jgi:hypothetical protein
MFGGLADAIKEHHGAKEAVASDREASAMTTPAPLLQPAQSGEAAELHVSTVTPMSERSSASATLEAYTSTRRCHECRIAIPSLSIRADWAYTIRLAPLKIE